MHFKYTAAGGRKEVNKKYSNCTMNLLNQVTPSIAPLPPPRDAEGENKLQERANKAWDYPEGN